MLLLVALSAAALLVGACGGSDGPPRASDTALDLRKIERGIVEFQREDTPQARLGRARCPKDPVVRKGTRIRCTVEVEGEAVPFVVTIKQADEHTSSYSTAPAREFLLTRAIEKKLTDPLKSGAQADCGDREVLFYEVGTEIPCRVRIPGGPFRRVSVVIKKPDGSFDVRISAPSAPHRLHLIGGSMHFVLPAGFRPAKPSRAGVAVAAGRLYLSPGNEILLSQYHHDRAIPRPGRLKVRRALAAQVTRNISRQGGRVLGIPHRTSLDGAPGDTRLPQ